MPLKRRSSGWEQMANDTISMTDLFPKCISVLRDQLVPMHYRALTELALNRLERPIESVNYLRQIEDVREKLLEAGRLGTRYTGAPLYLAYMDEWVSRPTAPLLFNPSEPVVIPADIFESEDAMVSGLFRRDYMITKTDAPLKRRYKALARGLIVEQHVAKWFECQWPAFYIHPDNYEQWEKPCDHDFKLELGGRIIPVDVAGQHLNGMYGRSAAKKATTLHLIASSERDGIYLHGFKRGKDFVEVFDEWATNPIQCLIVYLNCLAKGIDYAVLGK